MRLVPGVLWVGLLLLLWAGGCAKHVPVVTDTAAPETGAIAPGTPAEPPPSAVAMPPAQSGAQPAIDEKERQIVEESLRRRFEAPSATVAALAPAEDFLHQDVHFAFDSFALSEEAKALLEKKAAWLAAHPHVKVLIEGHCDERGTQAYNLALGERRANAVKQYLVALGIDPARLSTVSYGEERPLDPGHNEEAWAKNRRAHFVFLGP
ncbi:MAG: peptidoglycan-associated lipoprotein [Candidatus Tectimicrobiota bacterium]|nr:MAG: peptidoglycan-associated lipoprotein [Candidatus Tectomicrobia bacterium]